MFTRLTLVAAVGPSQIRPLRSPSARHSYSKPVRMGRPSPRSRIFSGDFHTPPENPHFSSLFCDFSLRSLISLVIVPFGPSFSQKNRGSQLAACFDRIGVERKIRRISILDGSQATEQDQGCGTHRRESRHTEENRRSIL